MTKPPGPSTPTRSPMVTDRERVVSVRLSDEEWRRILVAALKIGLKPSQFLRFAALERA